MGELLLYDVHERIATLTLNRPDKRNALSTALVQALCDALVRADADTEVGAVIIAGAGDRAFCAGGDLSDMAGDGLLAQHRSRFGFAELLLAMRRCGKPLIAAGAGHALGGGFGLMLGCDFVVVRRGARYGTPEVKRGLFPMMIMAVLLPVLGRRRTLELALTGREVDADLLLSWGAVNRVENDAEAVMATARTLASEVAALSPSVLALGRRALFAAEDMTTEQRLAFLHAQLTLNGLAEDAAEGLSAFFDKRPPQWTGR